MVGVATCYKVNFDPGFQYLAGSYLLLKLTKLKISGIGNFFSMT